MINSQHSVHDTPRTAYTEYCIHHVLHHPIIDCLLLPASLSTLSAIVSTQLSTFPQLQVNQWTESQHPLRLPPELPPPDWPCPDWPPPITPPISLDHGLQVHLQTCWITTCNCISNLARLLLQVDLQFLSITADKSISLLAQLLPASLHAHGLPGYLHTGSITDSKYICMEWWLVYWDSGETEVDRETGSTYLADPGVDRHHLISILSCHTMKIHTLSLPSFGLTHSVREISWSKTILWFLNAG